MKKGSILFDLYIFLIALSKGLGMNAKDRLYIGVFAIGCVAVATKMFLEKYSKKELLTVAFIIGIGLLNLFMGKTPTFLLTAIAICGSKNIDVEHVIKLILWTKLCAFVFMVVASVVGLIENNVLIFCRNGEFINRYSFGYNHPNGTHFAFMSIILMLLYLYGAKMNFIHYTLLMVSNYILYRFTFSRTGFIIGALFVIVDIIVKNNTLQIWVARACKNMYIWLFLLTLAVGYSYGHLPQAQILDKLLTGRVYFANQLLTRHVPKLLGSTVYNQYVITDSGYLALLYQCGVLACLWMSYCLIKLTHKLYAEKRYRELFFVSYFMVYGLTEGFFPSVSVNVSLIFIGEVIFNKEAQKFKWKDLQYLHPHLTALKN